MSLSATCPRSDSSAPGVQMAPARRIVSCEPDRTRPGLLRDSSEGLVQLLGSFKALMVAITIGIRIATKGG